MHHTVFDTPVIKPFLKMVSRSILKIIGWKTVDKSEGIKRYIIIAAPHTSNWGFPLFLMISFALDIKVYWLGKHTLFKRPFRGFFRWLGGIAGLFHPTGNIYSDMKTIKEFYSNITGKNTKRFAR